MWILVIVMLVENMTKTSGGIFTWIYTKAMMLPGIVIGLSFHEAGHAFMSYKLGDPTPKAQGRLTLNPIAHIDIVGFIFLLVAGFGWGEPVQIDPRYYKHRRRDELLVSFAGVVMNLLIAVVTAFIMKGMVLFLGAAAYSGIIGIIYEILMYVVAINLILMCFNLIPCPPLDGWGIITQIFNLQKYEWWYTVYRYGSLILMLLIIFNVTSTIITPVYSAMLKLLMF